MVGLWCVTNSWYWFSKKYTMYKELHFHRHLVSKRNTHFIIDLNWFSSIKCFFYHTNMSLYIFNNTELNFIDHYCLTTISPTTLFVHFGSKKHSSALYCFLVIVRRSTAMCFAEVVAFHTSRNQTHSQSQSRHTTSS